MYKNEEEMPKQPKQGAHPMNCCSMWDFKGQAMDQAYGQAGKGGAKSDQAKIHSQMYSGAYDSDS